MAATQVRIRLVAYADDLAITRKGGGELRFKLDGIGLTLVPVLPGEGHGSDTQMLTSVQAIDAPAAILELLERLATEEREEAAHRREWEQSQPERARSRSLSTTGIREMRLSTTEMRELLGEPAELVDFFHPFAAELRRVSSRLVQLVRWRLNRMRPAYPLSRERVEWSLDGTVWHGVPRRPTSPTPFGEWEELSLSDDGVAFVQDLLANESINEPLSRQLLLEAVELQDSNPRASLVLAVAAAEVGIKQFAGGRSASVSEDWLLSELPSPPIHRLWSEDYLGFFTNARTIEKPDENSKRQIIPSSLRRVLRQGVDERNKAVHAGAPPPDEEMLTECLAAVNDFLYALDWFAGQEWAIAHVRDEVRSEWELGQI
jgi:hypothetical protein